MSDTDRDEIINFLKAIRALIAWLGGGALVAVCGLIFIIVSDHFNQTELQKDVDWMMPKVQSLWHRSGLDSKQDATKSDLVLTKK